MLLALTVAGRPSLAAEGVADARRAFEAAARVSAAVALAPTVFVLPLLEIAAATAFLWVRAATRSLSPATVARALCDAFLALLLRATGGTAGDEMAGFFAAKTRGAVEPAAVGALSIKAAGASAIGPGTGAGTGACTVIVDAMPPTGTNGNTAEAAATWDEADAGSVVIARGTGCALAEIGAELGRKPHHPAAQAISATMAAPAQGAARRECLGRCRWPGISGSGSCQADATMPGSRTGGHGAASLAMTGGAGAIIGSLACSAGWGT